MKRKHPKPASLTALKKARRLMWRQISDPGLYISMHEFYAVWEVLDREVKFREWLKRCQDEGNWLCLEDWPPKYKSNRPRQKGAANGKATNDEDKAKD